MRCSRRRCHKNLSKSQLHFDTCKRKPGNWGSVTDVLRFYSQNRSPEGSGHAKASSWKHFVVDMPSLAPMRTCVCICVCVRACVREVSDPTTNSIARKNCFGFERKSQVCQLAFIDKTSLSWDFDRQGVNGCGQGTWRCFPRIDSLPFLFISWPQVEAW